MSDCCSPWPEPDPQFLAIMDDTRARLARVFRAPEERHHKALACGLAELDVSLLPPEGERLWTLNAVRVRDGVDEARVRKRLLQKYNIEIGAGIGPLAGKIWRIGLMGTGSTPALVTLCLAALRDTLRS